MIRKIDLANEALDIYDMKVLLRFVYDAAKE